VGMRPRTDNPGRMPADVRVTPHTWSRRGTPAPDPALESADKEHYVKLIVLAPDDTRRRSDVMRERQERKGRLWL
jgi:hypothetical protein